MNNPTLERIKQFLAKDKRNSNANTNPTLIRTRTLTLTLTLLSVTNQVVGARRVRAHAARYGA